jgi:cell division GTPase FtsZ
LAQSHIFQLTPNLIIAAIGEAGCSVLRKINNNLGFFDVESIGISSNSAQLKSSKAKQQILLKPPLTDFINDKIRDALVGNVDMVIIIVGSLNEKTNGICVPVLARMAKEKRALVLIIGVMPLRAMSKEEENQVRSKLIAPIKGHADVLFVTHGNRLFNEATRGKISPQNKMMEFMCYQICKCIEPLVVAFAHCPGLKIPLTDVKTMLSNVGVVMEAVYNDEAEEAYDLLLSRARYEY